MPRIKINGTEHEFPSGMNVLEACESIGIHIPHFCYHPALKSVGSCRMCKVEVIQGGRSRIDISCKVEVCDGIEILTDTPGVQKARQMTLEFLLANHPVDCPVCDDAGECLLQNYYMLYGKHLSRMREPKVLHRKAFDIGEHIVLDSERCVVCTRCVRFLEEITHTHELGVFGMGVGEELMLKPGSKLDNDYSGNVVDLCPVGALTDKDFRFKRRVWYLKSTPSICQKCSRGCNIRIDWDENPFHEHKRNIQTATHRTGATEYQRIQRLKPRDNPAVNGHWICDRGRYGYRSTDSSDRLKSAYIRSENGMKPATLADSIGIMAKGISSSIKGNKNKVAVVLSPVLTNEEIFAVWSLFRKKLNLPNLDHRIPIDPGWHGDDLLITPDPFPNRTGCEWMKVYPDEGGIGLDALPEAIASGKVDTLISILVDPSEYLDDGQLKKLKHIYSILRNKAELSGLSDEIILPAAAWGEYEGTFTNFQGRTQRLEQAIVPLGDAQPVWKLMMELSSALKKNLRWQSCSDVFRGYAAEVGFLEGVTFESIGPEGITVESSQMRATG